MDTVAIENANQALSTPTVVAAIDSFTDHTLDMLKKWETERRLRWLPGAEFPVQKIAG